MIEALPNESLSQFQEEHAEEEQAEEDEEGAAHDNTTAAQIDSGSAPSDPALNAIEGQVGEKEKQVLSAHEPWRPMLAVLSRLEDSSYLCLSPNLCCGRRTSWMKSTVLCATCSAQRCMPRVSTSSQAWAGAIAALPPCCSPRRTDPISRHTCSNRLLS